MLATLAIMCLLATPAIAQDADAVQTMPAQPPWIPSTFCRQSPEGVEHDCGPVTYVPFGSTQQVHVPHIVCRTCEPSAAPDLVEMTVLRVERDVSGETYTGPDDEPVLVGIKVRYLSGPIVMRTGRVRQYRSSHQFGSNTTFWLASDARRGYSNRGIYRQPALSPSARGGGDVALDPGQEAEGWIGGYLPRGTRQFAVGLRTGNGGYVFFDTQP